MNSKVKVLIFKKRGECIIGGIILLLHLGVGAYFDVKEHKIPNWLMLFGIGNGLLLTGLEAWVLTSDMNILTEPIFFLLRIVLVTALFFVLFLCRMIGAGDIKMAALICGYMGLQTGAIAIFSGFLIGAIWSLIKMIGNGILIYRFSCLLTYIRYVFQTGKITAYYRPERDGYDMVIPFGFCLFAGTLITLGVLQ